MKSLYLFVTLCLMVVFIPMTYAEPYSPSCETAIEKLSKSRKNLVPFQRMMELTRAWERQAYGELTICTGGGLYSVNKAVNCNDATWKAPERTKDVIEAEDQYLQERKEFEALFEQAKRICLDP